jgi:hypothetical protein
VVTYAADFDRAHVADWLARRYSDEQLAERMLAVSGLRFSPAVKAELANTLSALGSLVLVRELVRNAQSLADFPDYLREVEPLAPGSLVVGSRGPSRSLLIGLSAR